MSSARTYSARIERLFQEVAPQGLRRYFFHALRLGYLVARKAHADLCLERAASLSFTTTVSFIPLAILLFGIFGSTGQLDPVVAKIENYLVSRLVPEDATRPGEEPADTANQQSTRRKVQAHLGDFIETLKKPMREGQKFLNPIAVLFLFVSVASLFRSAERTFAVIWGVQIRRGFFRRFGSFWLLLTVPPLILLAAEYIKGELPLERNEWLGWAQPLFGVAIAFFAFALVYHFLPNTVVRTHAAAWGALFGAIGWEVVTQGYAFYIQTFGGSNIYGAIGVIPVVLILIYFAWTIALVGAELTYCIQNYTLLEREVRYHLTEREGAPGMQALVLMERVYLGHHGMAPPPTIELLATEFDLPISMVEKGIQPLLDGCLLMKGATGLLVPAHAAEQLSLAKVAAAYPNGLEFHPSTGAATASPLAQYLSGVGAEVERGLAGKTFVDFLPSAQRKV